MKGFDAISPGGIPRTRPQADHRLTECKACPHGIFASERRIWARQVLPSRRAGLVHYPTCEDPYPGTEVTITAGGSITGGQHKSRTNKH